MGLYDEQFNARRKNDQEELTEAIDSIAKAVLGERVSAGLNQQETALSAIEEVIRYYKIKSPKGSYPENDTTIEQQLEYRMRPLGISYRSVVLDKCWYKRSTGAFIGTLKEDGSSVALIPNRFYGYSFFDHQSGKRINLNHHTEQLLEAEAICFYSPLPPDELKIKDLITFMARQINISDLLFYFGVIVLIALLGMLLPLFNKWLFGVVLSSGSMKVLMAIANFLLCYSVCYVSITACKTLIGARITTKTNVFVEAAVMNRVLNLPAKFFKDYSSGELTQRASYVNMLCGTIIEAIATTGCSAVFSLLYIAQIFSFAPMLVIPALAIIISTVLINIISITLQIKISREQMLRSSKTSGLTHSIIAGMQKIKLTGSEKRIFSRWAKLYADEASLLYNPPRFLTISHVINLAISLFGTLLIYTISFKSSIAVSDYYAFNTAFAMILSAFGLLTKVVSSIAGVKPMLDMIEPILKTKPEFSQGKKEIASLNGEIGISHVTFAYDENSENVIDNLSIRIAPGEYVAIVGPTGCGKSTLIRLLLGFETPQKGDIYFDHYNLSCLDPKSVRRLIGTVMQDGKLFTGSIFSNIAISAPNISLEDAWNAAELASLADDIRKMPMGMNTMISEGQGGLSGGQRQRLLIARALALKPRILIFDEATSALDNITQKKVSEAIDALKCTRIVVAHRLSTIQRADRIIYLENGNVAEEGTYQELIEKDGRFASLIQRQRLDVDTTD